MPRLALAIGLLCITISTAHAQSAGDMQLDEFRPAMDSRGYLTLNGTEVLGHEELSFGLGSLEWGHHLLAFEGAGGTSYSVDNVVQATLVAALGLKVAGVPFEVGSSLPFSVMNGTQDRIDGQGIGDLGLHLKARLAHVGPLGVGALASVYLPTASPRDRFLGEPAVTPQVLALADLALGRWRLAANAGVRVRGTSTFTDTMMGTMGTITMSTELPGGLAAAYAIRPEKLEAIAEVFGAMPIGAHQGYQPLEALGGIKVYLAKNSYLSLGAGRGLIAQGGNPDMRAFIGIVFEPKAPQQTHAHLEDDNVVAVVPPAKPAVDPDADRDGDGVPDKDDRCPDEPGEHWNQGCPYHDIVVDEGSTLVVLGSIDFEFDSAKLKESSFHVLDAVAKALTDNPDIERVEVGGHTDERGSAPYNLDLSNRRAASVVAYLAEHGIAAKRLSSHGYGLTKPLDTRHDEAAWAKNRRVEFVIKQRAGKQCDNPTACAAAGS
jgi:outer membrane protein OmpA-like peptidoglycan-associated protein